MIDRSGTVSDIGDQETDRHLFEAIRRAKMTKIKSDSERGYIAGRPLGAEAADRRRLEELPARVDRLEERVQGLSEAVAALVEELSAEIRR